MKPVKFEENELMVMAIFAEKTRQDTVMTLKEALEVLEETKEDVSDEEMIEIVSTLVEKLQQIEANTFYSIHLASRYLIKNIKSLFQSQILMKFSKDRKFRTFCHIEADASFILIWMQWKSSIFYSNHFLSLFYKIRQFSKTKAVNIESPDITISICNDYITD